MKLQVFTSQIRYVKAKQPDALDVTRVGNWLLQKAGKEASGIIFAPSWELFNDCKAREVSEAEYTARFLAEMRISYRRERLVWDWYLAQPRVVMCCYEAYPEFCHRHILRSRILPALGAIDCGEIS